MSPCRRERSATISLCGQPPLTFITPTKCRQKPKSTGTETERRLQMEKSKRNKEGNNNGNGRKNIIKNKHYAATDNEKNPRKFTKPPHRKKKRKPKKRRLKKARNV